MLVMLAKNQNQCLQCVPPPL